MPANNTKSGKRIDSRKDTAKKTDGGLRKSAIVLIAIASVLFIIAVCVLAYCYMFYIRPQREMSQSGDQSSNVAAASEQIAAQTSENSESVDAYDYSSSPADGTAQSDANQSEADRSETDQSDATQSDATQSEMDGAVSGDVENYDLTIFVNGEETECLYTGKLASGKTVGEGHYEFLNEEGEAWTYDGTCLRNNIWTGSTVNQPVEFGDGEYSYSGTYTGELLRGVQEGQGTLTVTVNNGFGWTYTGGWKNGSYDGYGELIYDNENIIKYIGNFESGQFRPTLTQLVSALNSGGNNKSELSQHALSFIEEHESDFRNRNTDAFEFERYNPFRTQKHRCYDF